MFKKLLFIDLAIEKIYLVNKECQKAHKIFFKKKSIFELIIKVLLKQVDKVLEVDKEIRWNKI